jgi:inorganic phosphate transporter, PiT family
MTTETILIVVTLIVGFYMAWNIGANDVANAMGTSVGSKALTMKRAVILAAILEFSGAFFAGSQVSETVQKGIVSPDAFSHDPMIFAIGMMGALLATGIWLQLASYFGLPVSTTHAIIGAVAGFGVIVGGIYSVDWVQLFIISVSWVLSPLLSGALSFFLFSYLQKKILFAFHPLEATKKMAPWLVFLTLFVLTLALIYDGLEHLHLDFSLTTSLFIALFVGIIAAVIAYLLIRNIPVKPFQTSTEVQPQQVISMEKAIKHLQRVQLSAKEQVKEKSSEILNDLQDLNAFIRDKTKFSIRTSTFQEVEKVFVYLQILSASLVAFGHGANDVANAIGPVAAVITILQTHAFVAYTQTPIWLLALGGGGIVIGLATWGWRVIQTIGNKITHLTPSRGFCAEFGAAFTILFASKLGIPVSTTHCLVGSVLGVGLARGLTALNLRTLKEIVLSWVITIPASGIICIFIFYLLRLFFY